MPAAVETMMYAKEVPWHKLGTYIGEEPLNATEAIVAAGLDWDVEKRPLYVPTGIGGDPADGVVEATGHWGVTRVSDDKVLGVVQGRYQIIQNKEAFAFMDSLTSSELKYETAGALKGGRKIWLLAEMPERIEPIRGDVTIPYLLLSNGHDGRTILNILPTTTRVVCQNTLNLALGNMRNGVSIRHTGSMHDKLEEAQRVLGFARREVDAMAIVAAALAQKNVGVPEWEAFLDVMAPLPLKAGANPARANTVRESLTALFESGAGTDIPGVRGSGWGALQAVTDYTSHFRTTRGGREARLESVWYGSGNAMNQKALRTLIAV
jgi:phage/plasmid-like protein (TIGR03299 family)